MPKKPIKFKEAFERLERIVADLEGDEVDIEEAMKKYEEGLALVGLCKESLEKVENKIKEIQAKS